MSCQVRLTANILEVFRIKRSLFLDDCVDVNWLQSCETSVAPTGDLIAIGYETRLVILTSKWDSVNSMNSYHISFTGLLVENDPIRAVLCLPIVGQQHSSHVGPDWTCVMVGFESGFIRIYSEIGRLLYEDQLHPERITSIKCQSQHNPRPDISPGLHIEEIYVQYQSNVCIIAGTEFFPALRNYRTQLAQVQAGRDPQDILAPPINLKKWGYTDQSVVKESAVVGLNLSSTFDHLLTASTCGGFDSKFRSKPPHSTLVIAVGSKPFLGYHYALEGAAQPVLSDVVKAAAHKIKSVLPSWLTGHKPQVENQMTLAMQPTEQMGCRFGLCDAQRTCTGIILSADRKFAAVTDNLGRVTLIDAFRGVVLRIFKGYREAQCAFVQVPEEKKSKHRIGDKVALFLVIYSPKTGTLQIFSAQQGTRITSFKACKNSRLIYNDYGLMGFSTSSKSRFICSFTTGLIDNDGSIKEILIPFHYALSEKTSKRARDIHVYKKIRQYIKCNADESINLNDEIVKACGEFKTVEIKNQFIDMLLSTKDISIESLSYCCKHYSKNLNDESNSESLNNLRIKVTNVLLLLEFHSFITNDENLVSDTTETNNKKVDVNLNDLEREKIKKLLDLGAINDNNKRVSFKEFNEFVIHDFISAFDLTQQENISLKKKLDNDVLLKISEILFGKFIEKNRNDYGAFWAQVKKSAVNIQDLISSLLKYWISKPFLNNVELEREMNNISNLFYVLFKTSSDLLEASKLWESIREILAASTRPFPALTTCILFKAVIEKLEIEPDDCEDATNLDENMEILSQEICEWSLLIGKLEDVSLLSVLLTNLPIVQDCTLPKLKHEKFEISLNVVLKRKGSVSEFVARWLTLSGITPRNIVLNDYIYKKSTSEHKSENIDDYYQNLIESSEQLEIIKNEDVFKKLNLIKRQFPYSLEAGMILLNMSWEYILQWKNDVENLEYLEACIKCLDEVPNYHVRQGLYNLIWNNHLRPLFKTACKLINQIGKLPKECFCRQDTQLSDVKLSEFIVIVTNFLDSFTNIIQEIYNVPAPQLNFEPIWENGGQPLVELALQQKCLNYELLHLHYEVCLVLQMVCKLPIKHNKVINSILDPEVTEVLFSDFQTKPVVDFNKTNTRITSSRTQLLKKVITASIEAITFNENEIYTTEHVQWMAKCVLLGRTWNMNLDELRICQVIKLYERGFDITANELVSAINDVNSLGLQLLEISGRRLAKHVSSSTNFGSTISALSPELARYINSLSKEWCAPSLIEDLLTLSSITLSCLDEDIHEYKLALSLLDACQILKDLQSTQ